MRKTLAAAFAALILGIGLVWTQPTGAWLAQVPAAASSCATTLNPADTDANLALSNGNLTATKTGSSNRPSSRATVSKSSGKWYFEFSTTNINDNIAVGLANSSYVLTVGLGVDTTSEGDIVTGGAPGIYYNNSQLVSLGFLTTGVGAIAFDLDNLKIWARNAATDNWNNSGAANPATNTGGQNISPTGALFPAVSLKHDTDNITLNFGAVAFANAPPSGFSCVQ